FPFKVNGSSRMSFYIEKQHLKEFVYEVAGLLLNFNLDGCLYKSFTHQLTKNECFLMVIYGQYRSSIVYSPLKCGCLFSKNAYIPSLCSLVCFICIFLCFFF